MKLNMNMVSILSFVVQLTLIVQVFGGAILQKETPCDVMQKCNKNNSDLDVLECVQGYKKLETKSKCYRTIYANVKSFFEDRRVERMLRMPCYEDMRTIHDECGPGDRLVVCALRAKDRIEDFYCQYVVQRLERIVIADFSLVSDFKVTCRADIIARGCNAMDHRLDRLMMTLILDDTLDCLQRQIDVINSSACKQEIFRLSELQGEDVQMDLLLKEWCLAPKKQFCSNTGIYTGTDALFRCLQNFISHPAMPPNCREQLLKREKLIVKDSKISKGLVKSCRDDIKAYRCRRLISDDKVVRLAQMLLCLENAIHNDSVVTLECRAEMSRHRQMLMTDFRLTPEVVTRCSEDIQNFCKSLETGGKTIHCLLESSRPRRRGQKVVSAQCQRSLELLLKVADVSGDWRIDPLLQKACEPVARSLCKDVNDNGGVKVVSCLMDNLESEFMTSDCTNSLLQVQYFVSRDFKLDTRLYAACRQDAVALCHAKEVWHDDGADPDRGPLILPCLYRYMYRTNDVSGYPVKLQARCKDEVKRVMRQRSAYVELLPDVEEACMEDLGAYCSNKVGPGQEMLCLQDKYKQLRLKCRWAVGNFTVAEASDMELNPVVKTQCRSIIDSHCRSEYYNGKTSSDNVMNCLIKNKNSPDVRISYKCRAAIEHFQLITVNDYHFTVQFKEACRPYVLRYCRNAHTKAQVVECLSEITQNDTLKDEKYKLSKECRFQLRSQLLQQREFIDLDPKLKDTCDKDIRTFCPKLESNSPQILECLQENIRRLSNPCHKMVFRIEKHDFTDSSSDYTLLTVCKQMIKDYCDEVDASQVFVCLKRNKDDLDSNCRRVVLKRMVEQSTDYRLNPALQKGCSQDIGKFCLSVMRTPLPDIELEGKMLHCLKMKFREGKLRKDCEKQLSNVLKESALNYKLNPLLRNLCPNEIESNCKHAVEEEESGISGRVEECLKVAFLDGLLTNRACRIEVAGMIEEAKADIHVDPLLHQACTVDIAKFCSDVPQGAGRVLQCLQTILKSGKPKLQQDCESKLSQRMEMFKNAEPLIHSEVRDVRELLHHVVQSPARLSISLCFIIPIVVLFLLGYYCARLERRFVTTKNK